MEDTEGCAIAIVLEGKRPMTVEIQALVVPSGGDGGCRRTVDGISHPRLLLLMGVLQKRCGIVFGRQDVYVNVVGRVRLDRGEGNAGDLAIAVALVSSLTSIPVRSDTAFVGAVDLSGELREVQAIEKRLHEARRMGFSRVVSARRRGDNSRRAIPVPSPVRGIEWIQCDKLLDAIGAGLITALPKRRYQRITPTSRTSSTPERIQDLGLEIVDGDDDYGG
jgi:DNA repair protein RadA/Sms